MSSRDPKDRQFWAMTIGALALVYLVGAGIIVIAAAAFGGDGGSGGGGGEATTASITLSEFAIDGQLSVPAGDITLDVKNEGTLVHNLQLEGDGKTKDLNNGESDKLALGELSEGSYVVYCAISGHRESGMEATLTVTAAGTEVAAPADSGSGGGSHSMTPAEGVEYDKKMIENMTQFLNIAGLGEVKDPGTVGDPNVEGGPRIGNSGNRPMDPSRIGPDGAKEFDITARVGQWEIEPGKVVEAWMYNDQVPGPWIKVNVGDKVRVNFKNETPGMSDIHFHGILVPNAMDGVTPYTQPKVGTGESFTYEFTTREAHVGMYHAHAHGEVAVPNGMFGAFQVGDMPLPAGRTISGKAIPANVRPVFEFPLVMNDAGNIGMSLNGKSFPATAQSAAIVVKKDDWFIVHYFNEGLQNHPMHMHGFPQLVYAKDGIPLDQPYWADTILVGPGERYTLLVHATEPGAWVWHCHILNHVEQKDRLFGMAGAVVVTE